MFHKTGVFENSAKFTWQHPCWDPFAAPAFNFIKKETQVHAFSKFCKIFKSTFLIEELWAITSKYLLNVVVVWEDLRLHQYRN